ncbi:hypothetical protein ABZ896_20155 [Streptomyces sp. NPDC047072]|uniref:hypothetical protein n=1 Tax=Streptomyces sp. NPDC047072 TaxID=3154809 RepID=UPI0033E7E2EF
MTARGGYGMLARMRDLERQLGDVARLLDGVGDLPPLDVTFTDVPDDGPCVIIATPHQLPLAEQRLAVDQIAQRVGSVPAVGEVLMGRYGASVRGQWADTVIVACTNAAPQLPGTAALPPRSTTTRETARVLRSLTAWARAAEPLLHELVITDSSRSHRVLAVVTADQDAHSLMEGLVTDTDSLGHRPGRRYRALLPTGHSLSVSVDSLR